MISAKANSVRSLLQRNLVKCPPTIKSHCYNTFVRPILEYACTIWSPYHEQNIYKLEMVQRRAARFVMNDYNRTASVSKMLHTLQWHTLEKWWDSLQTILFYKIIHNIVDINAQEHLIPSSAPTRGHTHRFIQLQSKVEAYKNFLPYTINYGINWMIIFPSLHHLTYFITI